MTPLLANDFAEMYTDVCKVIKKRFTKSPNFVRAFLRVIGADGYDHEEMLSKLEQFSHLITKQESVLDYGRQLEMVYNKWRRGAEVILIR